MGTWAHNMLSKCVMGPQHRRHVMFCGQHLMYWIYLMRSVHLVALASPSRFRSLFLIGVTLLDWSVSAWLAVQAMGSKDKRVPPLPWWFRGSVLVYRPGGGTFS